MPERLRTLRHCIFTDGVVEKNGSCSAAFCESAALRRKAELPQSKPVGFASSLWEGAFGMAAQFPSKVQSLRACPLPLGELSRSD